MPLFCRPVSMLPPNTPVTAVQFAPWVPMAAPKLRAGTKASACERSVNEVTLSLMSWSRLNGSLKLPWVMMTSRKPL
jgi:hypothetical protein